MKLEAQYEAQSNTMQAVQQSDSLQQAVDIQSGNIDNLVSGSSYTLKTASGSTSLTASMSAQSGGEGGGGNPGGGEGGNPGGNPGGGPGGR